MSQYVEVQCPVMLTDAGRNNFYGPAGEELTRQCEANVLVEMVWEPGKSNWGAVADGNCDIYVPGFWAPANIPEKCDTCGFTYTQAGLDRIDWDATKAAESLDAPEPDYDNEIPIEEI